MDMENTFPARIINDPRDLHDVVGTMSGDSLTLDFVAYDPVNPLNRFRMRGIFTHSHVAHASVAYEGTVRVMSGTSFLDHPFRVLIEKDPHERRVMLTYFKTVSQQNGNRDDARPNALLTLTH